jgi:uncharacterized lipoprotein NlpE involved in copper resistance
MRRTSFNKTRNTTTMLDCTGNRITATMLDCTGNRTTATLSLNETFFYTISRAKFKFNELKIICRLLILQVLLLIKLFSD